MSVLHPSTFEYLKPTAKQIDDMAKARNAAKVYADALDEILPDGPDKTWIMRQLRTVAMWANVSITRNADGTPRDTWAGDHALDDKDGD
jgi:hypothetical protein